jgi:hypothetical protein
VIIESHRFLTILFLMFLILILTISGGCAQQATAPQEQPESQESGVPIDPTDLRPQAGGYDPSSIFNAVAISNMLPEDGSKTKDTKVTVSAVIEVPSPEAQIVANMEILGRNTRTGAVEKETFNGSTRYLFEYTFDAEPDTYIVRLSLDVYVGSYSSIAGTKEEWEFGAGVRRTCLVFATKGPNEVSLDDPTADVISNGCTIPLGENLELTPDSPEIPSDFQWSLTVSSSDMSNERWLNYNVLFVGADETQYEEMTYDVSITYSYNMKATGSRGEPAGAHLYSTARIYDLSELSRKEENLYQRNTSVGSSEDTLTTFEDSDTITDEYQLTFRDDTGLMIGGMLDTNSAGSSASEVTFTLERIILTRVK